MLLDACLNLSILVFGLCVAASNFHQPDIVPRLPYDAEAVRALRRALNNRRAVDGDSLVYNSGSLLLDRSWDDVTLLSLTLPVAEKSSTNTNAETHLGLEIKCQQCYVKGAADITLSFDEPFNHTEYIDNVKGEVMNFTSEVLDAAQNITEAFVSGDFDLSEIRVDFTNVTIPDPGARLRIGLDGLEIYAHLNTKLYAGASYTQTLFHTNTEFGLSKDSDVWLGAVLFVNLILSAEAEIDLSTGFHIRLDDEVVIDMKMFEEDIAGITFNGGQIEYLPVQFVGAGGTLKAALQISAHIGIEVAGSVDTPDILDPLCDLVVNEDCPDLSVAAGLELAVYANIFETETSLTFDVESECDLHVNQSFQFAVGAIAGASVAVGDLTLGPALETSTPIWFATFGACALQAEPTTTTTISPAVTARAEAMKRELTTVSTKVVITGIGCESVGLLDCPVSLQTVTMYTTTSYLTTDIASDEEATFPATAANTVVTAIPFGASAKSLPSTTGHPETFTPQPTSEPDDPFGGNDKDDESKSSLDRKSLIIGLSVGLGVLVLVVVAAVTLILRRRRRRSGISRNAAVARPHIVDAHPDNNVASHKKRAQVHVTALSK